MSQRVTFLGPLARLQNHDRWFVGLRKSWTSTPIPIIVTLLFSLPGLIHALYVILRI